MPGSSDSLGELYVRLSAKNAQLIAGLRGAEEAMASSTAKMASQAKLLALGVTSAFAAIGAGALRQFMAFESSFAGVRKTVNATEEEFRELSSAFRDMAKQMPANVNEINKVGEAAGQLGIKTKSLVSFTKTMIDLGNTTNLSAEAAATQLARLANITGMSQANFSRLGSTIVALGNNLATTEAEIVAMAMRLAGAGSQMGLTEAQILSLAAALSSVGVEAEAGGSAISQFMIKMAEAVMSGGEALETFAATAGTTAEGFRQLFAEDTIKAMTEFLRGLKSISDRGGNVFSVLDRLRLSGIRMTDVLLRAANANQLFSESVALGTQAWMENTALSEEAQKRYETLESQIQVTLNLFRDLLITIGEGLAPTVVSLNKDLQDLTSSTSATNESLKESINIIAQAIVYIGKAVGFIFGGIRDLFRLVLLYYTKVGQMLINYAQMVISVAEKIGQILVKIMVGAINITIERINTMIRLLPEGLKKALGIQEMQKVSAEFVLPFKTAITGFLDQSESFLNYLEDDFWGGLVRTTMGATEEVKPVLKELGRNFEGAADEVKKSTQKIKTSIESIDPRKIDELLKLLAPSGAAIRPPPSAKELLAAITTEEGKVDSSKAAEMLQQAGIERGTGRVSSLNPQIDQMADLQREMAAGQARIQILEELGQMEVELTAEVQEKKKQILEAYLKEQQALTESQNMLLLKSGEDMFAAFGEAIAAWGGEQSDAYRAMFAASKAFAMAESIIKIQQGIASALSLGFPMGLAAAASVAAEAAGIISTIASVTYGGERAKGGPVAANQAYLVGEKGPELFSPASSGTILPNEKLGGEVKVVVNNYSDAKASVTEKEVNGQRTIEVLIRRLKSEISSEIRDGRGEISRSMESSYRLQRGK